MRFTVNIDYPVEKMEATKRRLDLRPSYAYADRVPVLFCLVPRYFAPIFGMRYSDLFKDVETQYYWQLQFAKYRIENIPEDYCTAPILYVAPYFDNVPEASAFGAEIGWPEDGPPRAIPTIKTVEQMDRWPMPEFDSGLWGKIIDWRRQMQNLARETSVTFNGEEGSVAVLGLDTGGLSPHMIAVDLVGPDFYWWMLEYPTACHTFLRRITQALMRAGEKYREGEPLPRGVYALAEDSAQVMSPELFKEFCLPYTTALYDKFGAGAKLGRGMHMCGNSTHLHRAMVEDARITSFDLFGYLVPPQVAAENLGGRMLLWGNINPMLMLQGSAQAVKAAALEALRWMAPCGGFMLGDGANVCPGTPLENLAALTTAAAEYGQPPRAPRPHHAQGE